MFCIIHKYCPKSTDNGHCTVYSDDSVKVRNRKGGICCIAFNNLPENKNRTSVVTINALKASKRAAANK